MSHSLSQLLSFIEENDITILNPKQPNSMSSLNSLYMPLFDTRKKIIVPGRGSTQIQIIGL